MQPNPERLLYEKHVAKVTATDVKAPQRVVRYFPETNLGNGHQGLGDMAKKVGINVYNLSKGEYVIFVNKAQTALKMFAPGRVLAHLKMPGSQRLDPRIISMVPRFFNGTQINYDGALREMLEREFGKRGH